MPHLYQPVVLLQCADAPSLTEALASLPARLVVWRISETVVALDPEREEEILMLLRKAGLTPKVMPA